MNIRPGKIEDAEALARLIDSFRESLLDHPDGVGAEQYLASVSAEAEAGYLQSKRYSYFIAEQDETLLGFLALRDGNHIFHLFVAREHQGNGVARYLWQEVKARVYCSTESGQFTVNSSMAAVEVYRKFGFEPISEAVSMHGISFLPMRLLKSQNAA